MSLKNPSWTQKDILLYNQLFYKGEWETLTDEEKNFCKTMYHLEEYVCGLDDDYSA